MVRQAKRDDCVMKKKFNLLLTEENGGVVIIVAAAMVFLLGLTAMVTDVGSIAYARRKMVTAADAAALAGAQELVNNPAQAEARALEYASKNGAEPENVTVTVSGNNCEITVSASQVVDFSFAKVLGFHSTSVSARAKAAIKPVRAVTGIVPFIVPMPPPGEDYNYGEEVLLKVGNWNDAPIGSGNFGAIALGGTGANNYRNNIKFGYQGVIAIGDYVDTEPGNMSGPTNQGVKYRLDHNDTIVIIPLYDSSITDVSGRGSIQVAGFACFEITGVEGSGNMCNVTGKFIKWFLPNNASPSSPGDPAGENDFGVYNLVLVE